MCGESKLASGYRHRAAPVLGLTLHRGRICWQGTPHSAVPLAALVASRNCNCHICRGVVAFRSESPRFPVDTRTRGKGPCLGRRTHPLISLDRHPSRRARTPARVRRYKRSGRAAADFCSRAPPLEGHLLAAWFAAGRIQRNIGARTVWQYSLGRRCWKLTLLYPCILARHLRVCCLFCATQSPIYCRSCSRHRAQCARWI